MDSVGQDGETAIELSLDSDRNIPFSELECWAYDLQADPEKKHRIRPILLTADGNSKKIAVPLLKPVHAHEPVEVQLTCHLRGCMNAGVEYYAAALSFDQESVPRSRATLIFSGSFPAWVRVYEITASGMAKLVRDLQPFHTQPGIHKYRDTAEAVPGRSTRVYVFFRSRPIKPGSER